MGKFEDLSGKRYGKLVVLNLDENQEKGKDKRWICRCDCGKIKTVTSYSLKSGRTTSCGCNRAIDIEGEKFGRLTVIKRSEKRDSSGNVYWICRCDCGNETEVQGRSLRKGLIVSCGCYHKEKAEFINKKHGKSRTRIYSILCAMKSRCYSQSDEKYPEYGGRGIKICDEWMGEHGFESFIKWAEENGYKQNLTIERIDVDGNYEPSNCRWATPKEQMQNTRRSRYVKYDGEIYSISELADKLNITYMTAWHRFRSKSFGMDELSKEDRIKRGLRNK